jgi:hypothetical protein
MYRARRHWLCFVKIARADWPARRWLGGSAGRASGNGKVFALFGLPPYWVCFVILRAA